MASQSENTSAQTNVHTYKHERRYARTDGQTSRKHDATGAIYWTGRGIETFHPVTLTSLTYMLTFQYDLDRVKVKQHAKYLPVPQRSKTVKVSRDTQTHTDI